MRSDLLGEALCNGVVFTPGRDDGQLLGGDPQGLGRPLPAAERSDGGHLCCTSEAINLSSRLARNTRRNSARGEDTKRSMLSQMKTKQKRQISTCTVDLTYFSSAVLQL